MGCQASGTHCLINSREEAFLTFNFPTLTWVELPWPTHVDGRFGRLSYHSLRMVLAGVTRGRPLKESLHIGQSRELSPALHYTPARVSALH